MLSRLSYTMDLFAKFYIQVFRVRVNFTETTRIVYYENLPMQYTENFSAVKFQNFIGKTLILLICLLKTLIAGTHYNRLGKAVLTSTHNLCFGSEIRKIGIPL